jgi:hypothetical protein
VQPGVAPSIDQIIAGARLGQAVRTKVSTAFLMADPVMFASLAVPYRLMIYSRDDLKALGRGTAPFYPAAINYMFSSLDGTRHYVIYSGSWSGGHFMVTCPTSDSPCEVSGVESWVS